jgi:hypothetical protein
MFVVVGSTKPRISNLGIRRKFKYAATTMAMSFSKR